MTKDEIKQRYKETVIPESKTPYHFEQRSESHREVLAYNPLCGDKFKLYLPPSNQLEDLHFHGMGCALSKASGSMMIKALEDLDHKQAITFIKEFVACVEQGVSPPELPAHLQVLVELKNFEGREDCITLTWKALLKYLETESAS